MLTTLLLASHESLNNLRRRMEDIKNEKELTAWVSYEYSKENITVEVTLDNGNDTVFFTEHILIHNEWGVRIIVDLLEMLATMNKCNLGVILNNHRCYPAINMDAHTTLAANVLMLRQKCGNDAKLCFSEVEAYFKEVGGVINSDISEKESLVLIPEVNIGGWCFTCIEKYKHIAYAIPMYPVSQYSGKNSDVSTNVIGHSTMYPLVKLQGLELAAADTLSEVLQRLTNIIIGDPMYPTPYTHNVYVSEVKSCGHSGAMGGCKNNLVNIVYNIVDYTTGMEIPVYTGNIPTKLSCPEEAVKVILSSIDRNIMFGVDTEDPNDLVKVVYDPMVLNVYRLRELIAAIDNGNVFKLYNFLSTHPIEHSYESVAFSYIDNSIKYVLRNGKLGPRHNTMVLLELVSGALPEESAMANMVKALSSYTTKEAVDVTVEYGE